jgi:hypothetical protein
LTKQFRARVGNRSTALPFWHKGKINLAAAALEILENHVKARLASAGTIFASPFGQIKLKSYGLPRCTPTASVPLAPKTI